MTATLGDILLVFLADRPGTAHDLQQRHAQTFGQQRAVDVTRVGATLRRLERQGHVRDLTTAKLAIRRICTVTDAGRQRQRSWLLDVPAEMTGPEAVDRVLLAMTASDRATFEQVAAACVATLEARHQREARMPRPVMSARYALEEFEDVVTVSAITWISDLTGRCRERDAA
ncbi:hypothetical protein [Actinoplanes subglobosus]|uniref:PadR family transcriptional regulator n=1 Tax=Actinoplanes subglobosus TaxID=1547892 RepID=A0ABV8IIA9_9ACTN